LASPSQPPVATKEIRAHRPSTPPPRRVDVEARKELAEIQEDRRAFLRKTAIGAGILALGAGLGYGGRYAQATGLSGNSRTVITDSEIAARVIAGVRIATEFIPDPVPAGTDADPYPGSAIQRALDDGLAVFIPSGTWQLTAPITLATDNVTIVGAGKSTKLLLDGVAPCISAGAQTGWLIANLATDGGGVAVSAGTQCRITEIWVNGVLTDNRPIGSPPPGADGYYGVRAADYITSGDGSESNPYNASAIEAAINALPSGGGIVFVKEGVWAGSRIGLGGSGQAGVGKSVMLMGAGAIHTYQETQGTYDTAIKGTHLFCGFDVNSTKCSLSVYHMTLSPTRADLNSTPTIKYYMDGTNYSQHHQLGGVELLDVGFSRGHPAIWWTGVNMPSYPGQVVQHWNIMLTRVSFHAGGQAIKVDNGDAPEDNGIFMASMRELYFRSRNSVNARTVDIDIANLNLDMVHVLMEDCSQAATDYALRIAFINGMHNGLLLDGFTVGDWSNAVKDAYIGCSSVGPCTVRRFRHQRDIDISGHGDFEVGTLTTETGVVNILGAGTSGQGGIILRRIPRRRLVVGTLNNPGNVLIYNVPHWSSEGDYIGATTPGGSPYTYTNYDARIEEVHLVGGTISDVSRDGQSVGTNRVVTLAPGNSIVISYSSAPTIKRFGVS
jgi:hypothetical protein